MATSDKEVYLIIMLFDGGDFFGVQGLENCTFWENIAKYTLFCGPRGNFHCGEDLASVWRILEYPGFLPRFFGSGLGLRTWQE